MCGNISRIQPKSHPVSIEDEKQPSSILDAVQKLVNMFKGVKQ